MTIGRMIAGSSIMLLLVLPAHGQEFPARPVRLLTGEPGGNADFTSRLIAQGLSAGSLGQQVIVDNRPSATTGDLLARAPADGYTLLVLNNLTWILPLLQPMAYDPLRDFAAVTLATTAPNILVVHPSVPAQSVRELIALAKARPGELNYASGPAGGVDHLAGELFKAMTKTSIVRVPYKGGGPALNELIAGQVQLMFSTAGSVSPHLKSGRLRGLAVTSLQPYAPLPGLPTMAASGVPGYESVTMTGILAPAKTPSAIINRLNQESVSVLRRPEVRDKFLSVGVITVGSTPAEYTDAIRSGVAKWGKVIRDAGIRAD